MKLSSFSTNIITYQECDLVYTLHITARNHASVMCTTIAEPLYNNAILSTPLQHFTEPVYFYINTVFGLHGAYVVFLFCTAWLLSGSLLGGVLACTFFFFNR